VPTSESCFLSGSLNAAARGLCVRLIELGRNSLNLLSYRNVSTVRKCFVSFVLTRTWEKNMKEMVTFSIDKDFRLEVIGLFDFLAGFCHVEFPECLTPLNKKMSFALC
jgi:hypothetical protein